MKKTIKYFYLGTNGTICSPVHLEDIYYIRKIRLTADENKVLTKDGMHFTCNTIIAEEDVDNWYEVDVSEGQM
jgi:hypothetical protein